MTKTDVLDEFECQLKCMGNDFCKSFNVHRKSNNTKLICELNNITWQMNPDDFKQKKGSTYFGSVQVSKKIHRCGLLVIALDSTGVNAIIVNSCQY